jgi:hypothetical protein
MRHILVFEPHALGAPNLEMAADLIQSHLDDGDAVEWLACGKDLIACDINPTLSASRCAKCAQRRDHAAALLQPRPGYRTLGQLIQPEHRTEALSLQTEFGSLQELLDYQVDGLDLGKAVASTLISQTRDHELDIEEFRVLIRNLLVSCFLTFRAVQSYLDHQRTDLVYIANGRVSLSRAAVRACQSRRVHFITRDMGKDANHMAWYDNTVWYDLAPYRERITRAWQAAPPAERVALAEKFYHSRAVGQKLHTHYPSFVADQVPGLLPPDWRTDRHNIVIYTTSEEEFAALSADWHFPFYQNQTDGLLKLHADLASLPDRCHVTVRMHPNMHGVPEKLLRPLQEMAGPRLTVVHPKDPISSYALLRAANSVVSYGSTVGIEAIFWGKPSILLGPALYQDLGGVHRPRNHEEFLRLLRTELPAPDREPALMYGYFMSTLGIRLKHCDFEERDRGTFKGTRLRWSAATHYAWAMVHRLPWLRDFLDRQFFRQTCQRLLGYPSLEEERTASPAPPMKPLTRSSSSKARDLPVSGAGSAHPG